MPETRSSIEIEFHMIGPFDSVDCLRSEPYPHLGNWGNLTLALSFPIVPKPGGGSELSLVAFTAFTDSIVSDNPTTTLFRHLKVRPEV